MRDVRWHVTNVAELLDASNLANALEAAQAIRSGWTVSALSVSDDPRGMRQIYAMRLDNLHNERGEHAAQLAESIAEFIKGLESAADRRVRGLAMQSFVTAKHRCLTPRSSAARADATCWPFIFHACAACSS